MAKDEDLAVFIEYGRVRDRVAFKLENVDADELRSYILGLWLVLEPATRLDMIRELAHYHENTNATMPLLSRTIADAYKRAPEEKT